MLGIGQESEIWRHRPKGRRIRRLAGICRGASLDWPSNILIKHPDAERASLHAEATLIVDEGIRIIGTLRGCDAVLVKGQVKASFKVRSLQILEGGGSARTL